MSTTTQQDTQQDTQQAAAQQPPAYAFVRTLREAVAFNFCSFPHLDLEQLATHHQLPLFRFLEVLDEPETKPLLTQLQSALAQRSASLAAASRHAATLAILHKLQQDPTSPESLRLASTVLRTTKLHSIPAEPAATNATAKHTRVTTDAAPNSQQDAAPNDARNSEQTNPSNGERTHASNRERQDTSDGEQTHTTNNARVTQITAQDADQNQTGDPAPDPAPDAATDPTPPRSGSNTNPTPTTSMPSPTQTPQSPEAPHSRLEKAA